VNDYDLVVIGASSAGAWAAPFAARLGARVALVEKEPVGGRLHQLRVYPNRHKTPRCASNCTLAIQSGQLLRARSGLDELVNTAEICIWCLAAEPLPDVRRLTR
jgi:glycine/D-amino acid oxidase-like deaminating enzyme